VLCYRLEPPDSEDLFLPGWKGYGTVDSWAPPWDPSQRWGEPTYTPDLRAPLAEGGPAIKYKSPLNVLEDTYDRSCYRARSYEYCTFKMTNSPRARRSAS
jgi:hypothetical protein